MLGRSDRRVSPMRAPAPTCGEIGATCPCSSPSGLRLRSPPSVLKRRSCLFGQGCARRPGRRRESNPPLRSRQLRAGRVRLPPLWRQAQGACGLRDEIWWCAGDFGAPGTVHAVPEEGAAPARLHLRHTARAAARRGHPLGTVAGGTGQPLNRFSGLDPSSLQTEGMTAPDP